jgi:hypothetical protein
MAWYFVKHRDNFAFMFMLGVEILVFGQTRLVSSALIGLEILITGSFASSAIVVPGTLCIYIGSPNLKTSKLWLSITNCLYEVWL